MRRLRLVAFLLCACVLTSCGFVGSTEDLLVAPYLNEQQAQVHEALTATLSLSSIQYKYPLSGDYRSPFIFYDLDSDGRQEAIVIYALTDSETGLGTSSTVRAKVLREREDGTWATAFDIAGIGEQVNFISFATLLERDSKCILIGWQGSGRKTTLGVYSFDGGRVREEIFESCNDYMIADFNGDGLDEIMLVAEETISAPEQGMLVSDEDNQDRFLLSLFGKGVGGRLECLDTFWLASSSTNVLQLTRGLLWDDSSAIYIDQLLDGSTVATEVVQVSGRKLVPLVSESEGEDLSATFRDDDLYLSTDLEGYGRVVIPILFPLPWREDSTELDEVALVQYMQLTGNGLVAASHAIVNWDDGYQLFIPERWLDRVAVVRPFQNSEWQFHALDDETGEPAAELLRIRVYSIGDYQDKFTRDYLTLEKSGQLEYYAYIPTAVGEDPLAITEAELRRMFALL